MGIDSLIHDLNLVLEVSFLDLLLSGDNAVMIALACRSLPPRQTRQAMMLGTGVAIALRVVLTLLAGAILQIPALKLLGGVALMVIAIQLTIEGTDDGPAHAFVPRGDGRRSSLLSAIWTIVVADLVMSVDNVLSLAVVANGSWWVLALGLLLSVPLLLFGSWYIKSLLERHPVLTRFAGALLGWFAGDIAVSDPWYVGWVDTQSPALRFVVPIAVAVYVVVQSRIIEGARPTALPMKPLPPPRPRVAEEALEEATQARALEALSAPAIDARPEVAPRGIEVADEPVATRPTGGLSPRALTESSPRAIRWLAVGIGGVVCLGVVYGVMNARMPVPDQLARFDCPAKDISLYYKAGGQRIRLTSGVAEVQGVVKPDNQIDWGDYQAASTRLGFFPPTKVLSSNSESLRVEGDMFDDVTCHVR